MPTPRQYRKKVVRAHVGKAVAQRRFLPTVREVLCDICRGAPDTTDTLREYRLHSREDTRRPIASVSPSASGEDVSDATPRRISGNVGFAVCGKPCIHARERQNRDEWQSTRRQEPGRRSSTRILGKTRGSSRCDVAAEPIIRDFPDDRLKARSHDCFP